MNSTEYIISSIKSQKAINLPPAYHRQADRVIQRLSDLLVDPLVISSPVEVKVGFTHIHLQWNNGYVKFHLLDAGLILVKIELNSIAYLRYEVPFDCLDTGVILAALLRMEGAK
jgi:hypothetical protein